MVVNSRGISFEAEFRLGDFSVSKVGSYQKLQFITVRGVELS